MNINKDFHHTNEQLNDELIIIEAAKLNPNHFAPLYEKYYKKIFNYVYQRIDCKDTSFDITSQIFLKALINSSIPSLTVYFGMKPSVSFTFLNETL